MAAHLRETPPVPTTVQLRAEGAVAVLTLTRPDRLNALTAQMCAELEDALTRLPFIYRSVVVLHDVEGWTVAEIADLLELGLPAAKQRLRRGRMMLVSALAEGEERRVNLKGVPMRCWDARTHVSEYLDGALDAATASLLEQHLGVCPTCPPLYASLVGVRTELGGLRDADAVIPPDLAGRLRARSGAE